MDPRRAIPGVDRLLADPAFTALAAEGTRERIVAALQQVQSRLRAELSRGEDPPTGISDPAWYAERVREELAMLQAPSLVPVINATGVVLHTNLGRAPLAEAALEAIVRTAGGYANLEYDIVRGERGSRYHHCVTLLQRLTGAEDALVVNNNAAAVVLALNTLAVGREAVISRGELVEIGGSFRVPDIMARSGAIMREVGATNRTYVADYAAAITERTGLIVKVHRSNFQLTGFVAEASVAELAALGRQRAVPLLHDLGSGLLLPAAELGLRDEPHAARALADGADLVAISGDKLLGGPQAGILLGRADLVDACRRNPLCRALRVDKLTLAALGATLSLCADPERARASIPALRMLSLTGEVLARRAASLQRALAEGGVACDLVPGHSRVGGGALPDAELPTVLVRLLPRGGAAELERALRAQHPAIVARVQAEAVLLDPRTITEADEPDLVRGVIAAWQA